MARLRRARDMTSTPRRMRYPVAALAVTLAIVVLQIPGLGKILTGFLSLAVIATDESGRILFTNPIAEALTGWAEAAARGRDLSDVFSIVNEETRQPVENPVTKVLASGRIVGLANHTILIGRKGPERPIDD